MELINKNTGEKVNVDDSVADQWISSCTPWMRLDVYLENGFAPTYGNYINPENGFPTLENKPLRVVLRNCYGIKSLEHEFGFNNGSCYSVYAPNGFMKTSFANVFYDIQVNRDSRDRFDEKIKPFREVKCGKSEDLESDNVFVIRPYDESYSSENASMLLVNESLKMEYDASVSSVAISLDDIFKRLKSISGLTGRTKTPEGEISSAFGGIKNINEFFHQISSDLTGISPFKDIKYSDVFNDKVEKIIQSSDVVEQLAGYIERYQQLVDKSPVLSRKFNHYSASEVSKSLRGNGFFESKHSINLYSNGKKVEVSDSAQLDSIVSDEKSRILGDKDLIAKFDAFDRKLSNVELRGFREFLRDHMDIIPELKNMEEFKKKVWLSYFNEVADIIKSFSSIYVSAKDVVDKVLKRADEEVTSWENVVSIFNKRFYVPFTLGVENKQEVILKGEGPNLTYYFSFDDESKKKVERQDLVEALSMGEKKALYILNILFEVNARIKSETATLFIVDDIVDSFDYKNKYAIIEYFNELSKYSWFRFIFLTHNFDFHRTLCSRLSIPGENRLYCEKDSSGVNLVADRYQSNPLLRWKTELDNDPKILIACIPFVRNLAEYTSGAGSDVYKKLTALLHIKAETDSLSIGDLEVLIKQVINDRADINIDNKDELVVNLISSQAGLIKSLRSQSIDIEGKIVLSIAIRLSAERYMISKITDKEYPDRIKSCQTIKLYEKYCEEFPNSSAIPALSQVNLMTPENIHINSFMYEPILDMSALHLYDLYEDVLAL